MSSQQPDEGCSTKTLSDSLGWNALWTLTACLSGRLVVLALDRHPRRRPSKFENDVAFFEDDLWYIFNVKPVAVSLSEKDHSHMDSMALELVQSLDKIVSAHFVKLQGTGDIHGTDPCETSSSRASGNTMLARYKRISAMIWCLQSDPNAQFSLVAGPNPTLFVLPQDGYGKVVKGRVKRWRAFLDRLVADAEISQGLQILSLQAIGISTEGPTDKEADVLERRAGVVIDAMFKEFRQLSCATVQPHEVKLRLSGLYTGPPVSFLEMFVSCCAGKNWYEAKCGSFPVEIEEKRKESFCAVTARAMDQARKLHLYVSHRGIINVTDMMPEILSNSSEFRSKALKDLFSEKLFGHPTLEDYKNGAMGKKVGLKEKSRIALMLARCLLEFFDENIELASHSWFPEQIFFVSPPTLDVARGDLYVSLRPNPSETRPVDLLEEFRPGNPTLLSFARLMLEIDLGEEIQLDIHPTRTDNEKSWVALCDLVEQHSEHGGNVQYLEAVKGCLHLCDNLPESGNRATGYTARKVLRMAIHEKIIRKLELIVNPQISKRRRQHSVSEHFQAKKPALESHLGFNSGSSFQMSTTQVEELDLSTFDSFHTGKRINPEDWLEDIKRISRYINMTMGKNFASAKLRPVRIAILDSGCNIKAQYFQDDEESEREARIVGWKDFVHNSDAKVDAFGHGTFMTMLAIESAPLAELYVARVAEDTTKLTGMEGNIGEAIRWAGIQCNADIISMSFGVGDDDGDIKQAILEVRTKRKDSVVFLASAGNSGPHDDIAFPARYEGVTSIRATDCMGIAAATNPTTNWSDAVSFATFGDNIPALLRDYNPEVCKPGSSVSTAIAAGIAATMLSYADLLRLLFPNTISEDDLGRLRTIKGAHELFLTLSKGGDNRIRFINLVKFFADRKTNFFRLCAIVECIRKAT